MSGGVYRGTSLIRNRPPLGPYSRTMPRALWWSYGGREILVSEVSLKGSQGVNDQGLEVVPCPTSDHG